MTKKFFPSLMALAIVLFAVTVSSVFAQNPTPSASGSEPWSFGVIPDTQWTVKNADGSYADDGYNPNTVPANIIQQINRQFVGAGVKFVIALGDTVDMNNKVNIDTRVLYAQGLYNTGIGFYPLRGNHEAGEDPKYLDSGPEFRYAFPQIGTGVNNNTPADITKSLIPATDLEKNPPFAKTDTTFTIGSNFSFPTAVNDTNKAVSYSFRYNNATFVLLDQFDATGNTNNSTIAQQQSWINDTLAGRPANTPAFVFAHKNLLGSNHKDNLFGAQVGDKTVGDPGDGNGVNVANLSATDQAALTAKQTAENNFLATLQANKVNYFISGHDHHHYVSLVTSPDGKSQVHQLIAQSASAKFYTPVAPFSANDVPFQEDLNRVGYYIVTVDGPRVTMDYYGDRTGNGYYGANGGTFSFIKMATLGYSLNGKENVVAQGAPYAMTDNTTAAAAMGTGFKGTSMSILSGINSSTDKTSYGVAMKKDITTGWAPAPAGMSSDVLTLWGMAKLQGDPSDTYVLSMSYDPAGANPTLIQSGGFSIVTRDIGGKWVNAVTKDISGTVKFVAGPWNSSYGLGTFGVDTATNTAWAVLNFGGDFAVGGTQPVPSTTITTTQFVYTSDAHYGITRSAFQGEKDVDAKKVNAALVTTINALPSATFPCNDNGVNACKPIGAIDFVAETGDIANRSEVISATLGTSIQSAATSWSQFEADYINGLNVKDKNGNKSPLYIVPGNHDVTNAIGYYKPMSPTVDATSMVQIYNLMLNPATPKTKDTYNYTADKVYYSKDISGVHVEFISMWPDSAARAWMENDLKNVSAKTPIVIFTHDQPPSESKHFTNPNGKNDINATDKFENLLVDKFADGTTVNDAAGNPVDTVIEQRALVAFLKQHPNIVAYFHGNDHDPRFYTYAGPDNDIALRTFAVDSPMKGVTSSKDETKLSYQVVAFDSAAQTMTVREYFWNTKTWGASATISLAPRAK